jgi:SAM-dependent methyltransferase
MNDLPGGERALREAYASGAGAWAEGPSRVYSRLADTLVGHMPMGAPGQLVVDVGAGTGVLSAALDAAGARPIGCDFAWAMLAHDRHRRPPAAAADARRLPLRTGSVDGVGSAFCINHIPDPVVALAEMARVTRPGGFVVSATYARTSGHAAKAAVDAAATEFGFAPPDWYRSLKAGRETLSDDRGKVAALAGAAGLVDVTVTEAAIDVGVDDPELLVRWRLGMAALAAFTRQLGPDERRAMHRRALDLVGPDPEPYRPEVVILVATVSAD